MEGRAAKRHAGEPPAEAILRPCFEAEEVPRGVESHPYLHAVVHPFTEALLVRVKEQILLLNAKTKETDLFRVAQVGGKSAAWFLSHARTRPQTGELANLDALTSETERAAVADLLCLRDTLYSAHFRALVQRLTGCGPLNERVDCAANVYSRGCQLLCHDDCISKRRVSYILYLSDGASDAWGPADGGALELYSQTRPGVAETTDATPARVVAPNFGTMVVFVVAGGSSMHSVQEVFCADKRRISIQGWFHSDEVMGVRVCAFVC